MTTTTKKAVLLVDSKKRDLAGAALIALQLKTLGVECLLEPLEAYKGCLTAYRPHMIIFNHLTGSHLVDYSRRLADLGVAVAVLPNEGIIYEQDSLKFNAGKYHRGAHIDCFFCWNEHHRNALMETGFDRDVRIEVIGPPRFDFYFQPWSGLFCAQPSNQAEDFDSEKRPTILVCTNFVFAQYLELPREIADKTFAPWKDRIPTYQNYWQAIEANHESRKSSLAFLQELVSCGKYRVVLRPHPNENIQFYTRWLEGLEPGKRRAITLNAETNITELILSCDLEISCENCTTALESWIAGKPTIELVLEKHPLFFHPAIAALNVLCRNPADIVPLVEEQLSAPAQLQLQEARKAHLAEWCNAPEGNASRKMAAAIAEVLNGRSEPNWKAFTFHERRRGIKLKWLRSMNLPYNFDPMLFAKKRLFKAKYANKAFVYDKTIRPTDVGEAMAAFGRLMGGGSETHESAQAR